MICDLAETYNILNYRGLSPDLVAVLVLGLRDNSRVKMKLSGHKLTTEQIILSIIADNLKFLAWTKTKDASKGGRYKEKSILKTLNGDYEKQNNDVKSFETVEEFELYMSQFNEG